jgi:hypothetical protein
MWYDLSDFSLKDMTRCGADLRALGRYADTMEQVADRIVRSLYDQLRDRETGERCCSLVRFFTTQPFGRLNRRLQQFALSAAGEEKPTRSTKCLVLLGTAGTQPEWNARTSSERHQAIPLSSLEAVQRLPMIAQMLHDFGVDIKQLVEPNAELRPGRTPRAGSDARFARRPETGTGQDMGNEIDRHGGIGDPSLDVDTEIETDHFFAEDRFVICRRRGV